MTTCLNVTRSNCFSEKLAHYVCRNTRVRDITIGTVEQIIGKSIRVLHEQKNYMNRSEKVTKRVAEFSELHIGEHRYRIIDKLTPNYTKTL